MHRRTRWVGGSRILGILILLAAVAYVFHLVSYVPRPAQQAAIYYQDTKGRAPARPMASALSPCRHSLQPVAPAGTPAPPTPAISPVVPTTGGTGVRRRALPRLILQVGRFARRLRKRRLRDDH